MNSTRSEKGLTVHIHLKSKRRGPFQEVSQIGDNWRLRVKYLKYTNSIFYLRTVTLETIAPYLIAFSL